MADNSGQVATAQWFANLAIKELDKGNLHAAAMLLEDAQCYVQHAMDTAKLTD